jgi:hypothetical protein
MKTKKFWEDASERAVRTFAQALLAILGAGAVNIMTVDWVQALSVAVGAAILSVLTSLASSNVGTKGTPSFLAEANGTATGKNVSEAAVNLDAADVDIEAWNAKRGNPKPEVVEADPNPSDVRDTNPKDDDK